MLVLEAVDGFHGITVDDTASSTNLCLENRHGSKSRTDHIRIIESTVLPVVRTFFSYPCT